MKVADIDTTEAGQKPSAADRIADTVRQAAHLSHEARLVRSMARDAREEGVHAVRRAVKRVQRRIERLEDLRDDAAHYVKHEPFKAVGIAFGIGVPIGMLIAWFGHRVGQRRSG